MIGNPTLPNPSNPWLLRTPSRARARLRLFCFPYAGKGASIFLGWGAQLPDDVELCALQFPGKETRIRERPRISLRDAALEVAHVLEPYLDLPFALLGHSLGSLLAFETAQELRAHYGVEPIRLFASGHSAPQRMRPPAGLHLLDDDSLLEALDKRYGSIPPSVREDRALLNLFLPALRSDLTMIETYRYAETVPLRCPISAFAGEADGVASVESIRYWSEQTGGAFRMRVLPGGHFFIQSERKTFLSAVTEDLEETRREGYLS